MSNVYIQEPVTSGKVLFHTTAGDIDVELWTKECPQACRNFIQHCLDGFYDDCNFHRVVPNFIVQTGDPDGDGGRCAFDDYELKDEFHSRLRFTRRGLLGMAKINGQNGSQFFFTLGPTPELDQQSTLFGKVTGKTIFNMLKLGEGEVCNEIPEYVHKIRSVEIMNNPFHDLHPRLNRKRLRKVKVAERPERACKATRNRNLLSFATDDEDQEVTVEIRIKSAHDAGEDPHLSKEVVKLESECDKPLFNDAESEPVDEVANQEEQIDEREIIKREYQKIFKELKRKQKLVEAVALKRVSFGIERTKYSKRDNEGILTDEERRRANEYNIKIKKVDMVKKAKERNSVNKKDRERDVLAQLEVFKKKMSRDTESDLYNHEFCVLDIESIVNNAKTIDSMA
ncbi:hypothetical protein ACOME3_008196 [Neoechinorhynchus agilis]